MEKFKQFFYRHKVIFTVLRIVAFVLLLKTLLYYLGWELSYLTNWLNILITANVFLYAFVMSSELKYFYDAERLPSRIIGAIETINDEVTFYFFQTRKKYALEVKEHLLEVAQMILKWLHEDEHLYKILMKLRRMNTDLNKFRNKIPDPLLVKLKTDKSNIIIFLMRMQTIKHTKFAKSLYNMLYISAIFTIFVLVISKFEYLTEAYVVISLYAFLNIFLLVYLRRLSNPFEYHEKYESGDSVSLYPIKELIQRLSDEIAVARLYKSKKNEKLESIEPGRTKSDSA